MMEPLITFKRTDAGDLVVVRMRNVSQVAIEGPLKESLMSLRLGSIVYNKQITLVIRLLVDHKQINVELID